MNWQTMELLLAVVGSVTVILGGLRSPHPVLTKIDHGDSPYLTIIYAVIHWSGVLAIVASLWFATPHVRGQIWLAVVLLWITAHAWYRKQERPQSDPSNAI